MKKIYAFSLGLVILSAVFAAAQTQAFGVIIFAEGKELSVFRQGKYTTFDLGREDVVGMPIFQGDLLQTDNKTFLELQLYPTKSILKVAENTTFQVSGLAPSGGGLFDLTYGRVRAKVEKLSGKDPFQVRGATAVAGVRGTDFGYDLVADARLPSASPSAKVYCFEGEVEVFKAPPLPPPAASAAPGAQPAPVEPAGIPPLPSTESVIIKADQMVNIREELVQAPAQAGVAAPPVKTVKFETQALAEEVKTYWRSNTFKAEPTEPDKIRETYPGLEKLIETPPEKVIPTAVAERPSRKPAVEAAPQPEPKPAVTVSAAPEVKAVKADDGKERLRMTGFSILMGGFGMGLGGLVVLFPDSIVPRAGLSSNPNLGAALLVGSALWVAGGILTISLSY